MKKSLEPKILKEFKNKLIIDFRVNLQKIRKLYMVLK